MSMLKKFMGRDKKSVQVKDLHANIWPGKNGLDNVGDKDPLIIDDVFYRSIFVYIQDAKHNFNFKDKKDESSFISSVYKGIISNDETVIKAITENFERSPYYVEVTEGDITADEELNSSSSSVKEIKDSVLGVNSDAIRKSGSGAGIKYSLTGLANTKTLTRMVEKLGSYLAYDGFSPAKLRNDFLKKHPKIEISEVIAILTTYVFLGNSVSKLSSKVTDKDKGQKIAAILNKYDIMQRKSDSSTPTLSRLAICFLPLLHFVRVSLEDKNKLQSSGIVSDCKDLYADVAYSCFYDKIDKFEDFHLNFSVELRRYKEATDRIKEAMTVEEIKESSGKYMRLAKNGNKGDNIVDYDKLCSTTNEAIKWFELAKSSVE